MKIIYSIIFSVMLFGCSNLTVAPAYVCPFCGSSELHTERHIGAAIWCGSCGKLIKEEVDPYISCK